MLMNVIHLFPNSPLLPVEKMTVTSGFGEALTAALDVIGNIYLLSLQKMCLINNFNKFVSSFRQICLSRQPWQQHKF